MTGQYVSNFFTVLFIVVMIAWCRCNYDDFKRKIATDPFEDYELPNTMVGIGVLGTFFGVSVGLFFFDTGDITASVRSLLASMETAFFTSVTGMMLSFFLKYKQHQEQGRYYETHFQRGYADVAMLLEYIKERDAEDKKLRRDWEAKEDERRAHMLFYLREGQKSLGENLSHSIAEMTKSIVGDGELSLNTSIRNLKNSLTTGLNELQSAQKDQAEKQAEQLRQVIYYTCTQATELGKIPTELTDNINKLQVALDMRLVEVKDSLEPISAIYQKIADNHDSTLKALEGHTAVLQRSLSELAGSMVQKLTEAQVRELTRVMQGIVTDFNVKISEQFGENFIVFNDAVGELTRWQERYREDLQKLHDDQQNIIDKIKDTEKALASVAKATDGIAYSAQTLQTITEVARDNQTELNQVLAEQAEFVETTEMLMPTMENLASYVRSLGEDMQALAARQNKAVHEFSAMLDDSAKTTGKQLEKLSKAQLQTLNDSTTKAMHIIEKQLADTVTKANDKLAKSAERVNADLESKLNDSLQSLGSALSQITEQFARDYRPLVVQMSALVSAAETLRTAAAARSAPEATSDPVDTSAPIPAQSPDGRTVVLDDAN